MCDKVSLWANGDFYVELDHKAGVMDSSKNWIVPIEFDEVVQIRLNNERYPVMFRGYKVMRNGRWGLYAEGRQKIPAKYRQLMIMEVWSFNWYKAQNENGSWCLLDENGKKISDTYEEMGTYSAIVDRMAVKNKGKWGFVDSKGKVQIACKYAEVQEFHYVNGLSLVKDGNRSFYVDCSGTEYYAN